MTEARVRATARMVEPVPRLLPLSRTAYFRVYCSVKGTGREQHGLTYSCSDLLSKHLRPQSL
jgi:hypothetical protein